MKKPIVVLLAASASSLVWAVDIARVLSATPVLQQVPVARQVCTDQTVEVQQPRSGAGAAIGAIAGGALGSAAGGRGGERAAATVLGALGGAILGERLEGPPESELRTVRQCSTQTVYENRAVAYDVVYEYAGKEYRAQLPHDPGPRLALQIGPADLRNTPEPSSSITSERSMAQPAPYPQAAPVYVAPAPVYVPPAVVISQPYPVYYSRPYYPPITLEFGFGHWGGAYRGGWRGGHRGGHHHWR